MLKTEAKIVRNLSNISGHSSKNEDVADKTKPVAVGDVDDSSNDRSDDDDDLAALVECFHCQSTSQERRFVNPMPWSLVLASVIAASLSQDFRVSWPTWFEFGFKRRIL